MYLRIAYTGTKRERVCRENFHVLGDELRMSFGEKPYTISLTWHLTQREGECDCGVFTCVLANKLGNNENEGSSTDDVTQSALELARWKIASQLLENAT